MNPFLRYNSEEIKWGKSPIPLEELVTTSPMPLEELVTKSPIPLKDG
jgi:hypothetical protein